MIPDHESTGNMVVEFSRNVKDFPLNRYSELRPVLKTRGYYLRIDPAQGARNLYGDGREFKWPGGSRRPRGTNNRAQFEFESYETQRRNYGVPLDDRDVEQASWPVLETELRQKGQQGMTDRSQAAYACLSAASWGTNTAAVTSATLAGAGHNWTNGTTSAPYIQICIQKAQLQILKATAGVVRPQDLVLVISALDAPSISQSPEIKGLFSNSVWAFAQTTGDLGRMEPGGDNNWSLPPRLYSTPVVVEDTVVVTSAKGTNTTTYSMTIPSGTAYLLCRGKHGGLVTPELLAAERGEREMDQDQREAIPVYATLCGFFKEEFTTETKNDTFDRITEVGIASDFQYVMSSVLSGYQFTAVVG